MMNSAKNGLAQSLQCCFITLAIPLADWPLQWYKLTKGLIRSKLKIVSEIIVCERISFLNDFLKFKENIGYHGNIESSFHFYLPDVSH